MKKNGKTTHFIQDMLLIIFSFATVEDICLRFSLVSKLWSKIAEHNYIWKIRLQRDFAIHSPHRFFPIKKSRFKNVYSHLACKGITVDGINKKIVYHPANSQVKIIYDKKKIAQRSFMRLHRISDIVGLDGGEDFKFTYKRKRRLLFIEKDIIQALNFLSRSEIISSETFLKCCVAVRKHLSKSQEYSLLPSIDSIIINNNTLNIKFARHITAATAFGIIGVLRELESKLVDENEDHYFYPMGNHYTYYQLMPTEIICYDDNENIEDKIQKACKKCKINLAKSFLFVNKQNKGFTYIGFDCKLEVVDKLIYKDIKLKFNKNTNKLLPESKILLNDKIMSRMDISPFSHSAVILLFLKRNINGNRAKDIVQFFKQFKLIDQHSVIRLSSSHITSKLPRINSSILSYAFRFIGVNILKDTISIYIDTIDKHQIKQRLKYLEIELTDLCDCKIQLIFVSSIVKYNKLASNITTKRSKIMQMLNTKQINAFFSDRWKIMEQGAKQFKKGDTENTKLHFS